MESIRRGRQSVVFPNRPVLAASAAIGGKKEGEGPLAADFDLLEADTKLGEASWEKAERRLQQLALDVVLQKVSLTKQDVDVAFSGDLLNQCISSSFTLRRSGIPMLGLYGACSTMAEALLLSAAAVNAGYARTALALTSSHFAASERQYRFPLGYGAQRTPTSQWTVTGAGAALLRQHGKGPRLTCATVGTVCDLGITDANNMGAAMAPAAHQVLRAHFDELGRTPEDYDLIVTGDLGKLGKALLCELFSRDGVRLGENYTDCGLLLYDLETQDVRCGGSGCGCSAVVLCGHLHKRFARGELRRLLFCGTGALLSPLSTQQGESIPSVCHAVALEQED